MDELLKKYSIDEISEKTSISPVFLQKLAGENFDKIDKLKFKGFLQILKSEYKDIDFSDLEKKANEYYFIYDASKTDEEQIIEKVDKENNKNYLFVTILLIIIAVLLYYMKLNENNNNFEEEKIIEHNYTDKSILENNKSFENKDIKEKNISKKFIDTTLKIEPLKKVWFKVYYLDLNKSKEFITNDFVELNITKKMFIKFGHGMIKLAYNGKTLSPNRKKITRIIIQNGEMNITNKKLESFK